MLLGLGQIAEVLLLTEFRLVLLLLHVSRYCQSPHILHLRQVKKQNVQQGRK